MNSLSFITRTDPETGQPTPPEGKRKIFLSYKHSDEQSKPLCCKMASYILERHDVAVWFDNQLTAGESYDNEIEKAIKEADAFVLLLSQDILQSDYIWEREIPLARKQQVAVMPVIAGLCETDIAKVEAHLGRVHMPKWFSGEVAQVPLFDNDALEQFHKGLAISLANKDLLDQAVAFYEKGRHKVSLRHLTAEQVFARAYGCLFGLDPAHDVTVGVRLMDSILNACSLDEDFDRLQEQVALELLKHFYRTDQPDLFFVYLQVALSRSFRVHALLCDVYHKQWHTERLRTEHDVSMAVLRKSFRVAQLEADFEQVETVSPQALSDFPAARATDARRVGELHFNGHTAYFRRCPTDPTEAELVLDGRVLGSYDAQRQNVDTGSVFLGYDQKHGLLYSLCAEFDHYGPETIFTCDVLCVGENGVRRCTVRSEWIKGRWLLPYTPYVLDE